ncbi:hypothetical protein G647_05709 [Cladophialophora carrionii CBS 160.54]|uniref:Uncharacterized protein n=1 Tax=Cladophialophora carrionii CBS 160.54 TaxID=1279043 RepID=V9DD87_9EURO|nr:uncharacterized protein G647_05709 [Cladophialophora carrionii CBS 160.54]ETI23902.1 hypothetical protein G647_05709 [Cladophialophora carrionii CBS 160.54]
MSSPTWQDRRFMFPVGKEVHQGSTRRMSGSSASSATAAAESPVLTNAVPAAGTDATPALPEYPLVEKKVLSNPDAWGGDRRFMGRAGKEVHQPARRPSGSSATKPEVVPKSSSPPATSTGGGIAAAIAGRRRSSASQGGVFSGLMANRSSHEERRQSWDDMKQPGGSFGGFLSNLVSSKPAEKK